MVVCLSVGRNGNVWVPVLKIFFFAGGGTIIRFFVWYGLIDFPVLGSTDVLVFALLYRIILFRISGFAGHSYPC